MSRVVVSALTIYPVKSCAPVPLSEAKVSRTGFAGDRTYLIANLDGQFVTGRTHPQITALNVKLTAQGVELQYPGMACLSLEHAQFSAEHRRCEVWGSEISGQYCGDVAQQWISDAIGDNLQLLYFSDASKRLVADQGESQVGFADGFPYLLTTEQSLQDLNRRLLAPVSMDNFRPNIVLSGSTAFAEDEWAQIRIGEVIFDAPKPCGRCNFTTVDPSSHRTDPTGEPLRTLSSFRKAVGDSEVVFGENLIAQNEGVIRVGDEVEILKRKPRPDYPAVSTPTLQRFSAAATAGANTLQLRCVDVIEETSSVKTFVFCTDPAIALNYFPGQFITLHLEIAGRAYSRCYTLSSSPSRAHTLSISVKREVEGVVSNWLHQHMTKGGQVSAAAPAGVFHLGPHSADKLLLLSAGVGITPMLSVLRYITDLSLPLAVHFHHSARRYEDIVARHELEMLASRHANVSLSFNLTGVESESRLQAPVFFARLRKEMLAAVCPDLASRDVMVCGPQDYMDKAREHLTALGLPAQRYHDESFVIAEPPVAQQTDVGGSFAVEFVQSGVTVSVDPEQTVLEAAEEAGIDIDYSCRGGVCGSCVTDLLSGELEASMALALSAEDIANGEFLPCCSYARSDLKVDA
ncbi:MAG: MOSC N-terminal beta barrel domain-containing protein [Pseudomonadales bacterium]